jgi:outer membrane putative beta-barrel porin/alpha-amylase
MNLTKNLMNNDFPPERNLMPRMTAIYFSLQVIVLALAIPAYAAGERPIDVIEDNSFLIEEAYNQEPGVVQHVFNATYTTSGGRHGWGFTFSQEWPVFSQDHQFSYTIPTSHLIDGADRLYGVGDILLNYRYQALDEGEVKPAFAPRFSLILPTGNRSRGTGNGVVGYQWELPFSKKLGQRVAMHANFGLTYLPRVRARLGGSTGPLSPRHSLVSYNLGASGIFALFPRFHLMLEWIGEFEESINDAGKARQEFQPTISPGFRAAVVNEEKLQVVVGAAAPVGLNRKADNYGAFLYLSIEHNFF